MVFGHALLFPPPLCYKNPSALLLVDRKLLTTRCMLGESHKLKLGWDTSEYKKEVKALVRMIRDACIRRRLQMPCGPRIIQIATTTEGGCIFYSNQSVVGALLLTAFRERVSPRISNVVNAWSFSSFFIRAQRTRA